MARVHTAVAMAFAGALASSASASLIVTYLTSSRSIRAEYENAAAPDNDFGPFNESVEGSASGTYPSGLPWSSHVTASQNSFFQPNFLKATGGVVGDADLMTPLGSSIFEVTFNISEATWMGIHVKIPYTLYTFASLVGPSDRVDFPLFGQYNDASDQRLWAAGDYTLTMEVVLDAPISGGDYTVEMWIPTPGALAVAAMGALAMGRRRRSVT